MGGDLPRDSGQRVSWGCSVLLLWARSHTYPGLEATALHPVHGDGGFHQVI